MQLVVHVPPKAPHADPGVSHCSSGSIVPLLQRGLSVVVVVLVDVVTVLVDDDVDDVVVVTQVPTCVGFLILNSFEPLFVMTPSAKSTLYESPPVRVRSTQPPSPSFGGRTSRAGTCR
jgi:hypothetical protein